MAQTQSNNTLVFQETIPFPWFGIFVTGGMGLAASIGGPILASLNDDILTGIVLVLVVGIPSFYAAWTFAQRSAQYTLTFDRREQCVIVKRRRRNKTEITTYGWDEIMNVRVDESRIHGMPCYGVTLVMRDGDHIPVVTSSLEHPDAECRDVATQIRTFIGRSVNNNQRVNNAH